jgi:hypothetical protein
VPGATSVCPARGSVLTTTGGALATVISSADATKPVADRSTPASIGAFSQRMIVSPLSLTVDKISPIASP